MKRSRSFRAISMSLLAVISLVASLATSFAADPIPTNVRLTNDNQPVGGYVSEYTLATGVPYTDATLQECSRSRGRQNEPSVAVNPRNTNVIIGSSNDYCAVYNDGVDNNQAPIPSGPIWLGYYRSENRGASFQSSLVPGYPDDTSPYKALAHVRTASAGDPVIAWDNHGRVFMGSESSDDPAGTKKTFGDVWVARFDNPGGEGGNTLNDGKRFLGSEVIGKGSSAPNLLGKFNDKTAIEVDRTGGRCDGNVYFTWSRFTGNGGVGIYFARSTDHGATWSAPSKISSSINDVQYPDISVTGNGNVYVTYRQFASNNGQMDAVVYNKSADCGRTFNKSAAITEFIPYDAVDVIQPEAPSAPSNALDDPLSEDEPGAAGSLARDCGDFDSHCASGYTFFRRDTQVHSTADQSDTAHEYIYIVYDPSKPGTEVSTGTTYGSIKVGTGSQSGIYFIRFDGKTGAHTAPALLDNQATGHQLFPDISADQGSLHVIWWDSRNDPTYSPARPIGNGAQGNTVPSLDVYSATAAAGASPAWTTSKLTAVMSNPNYEQFSGRTVPFAGDYLWVSSVGSFSYGVWTDWRDTIPGKDQREAPGDENEGADVLQCRLILSDGTLSGDTCPRDGGLDQNIYGAKTP